MPFIELVFCYKGIFVMKMPTANLLRLPKGLNSNSHLEQYHTQSAGLVFCMNDNILKGFWRKSAYLKR